MTKNKPKMTKKEKQREATRLALIEAAESLFARYGIDSVSLRQIGNAIDSGNSSVVSYYFGTKEDIVQAILEHRLPWLNQRQGELLEQINNSKSPPGLRDFLYALWYPLMEQTDKEGVHSLGGFIGELVRSGRGRLLDNVGESKANTKLIQNALSKFLPTGIEPYRDFRYASCLMITTGQLRFMDDMKANDLPSQITQEEYFADALRMAEAALTADLN